MMAVRDCGVGLALVPQGAGRFAVADNRPTVLFVGDDMHAAMGPSGFHRKSLKHFVRRCRCAVIVSSAPMVEPYAAAAASATMGMDVILVETRLEHEQNWRGFIEAECPGISMLISTVQPEGGVH